MRKTKPSGLVISGQLAESILLRMPVLTENLGPVAASSKRLASRYANTLRRGWAAGAWGELSAARIIYLQVPGPELPAALEDLLRSIPCWQRRVAVLLDATMDASSLRPLARAGASVASLAVAQAGSPGVALIDGDAAAVSSLRAIVRKSGMKTIHMKRGSKDAYNAGAMLAASISGVVAAAALRAVRGAGVDPATAKRILSQTLDAAARQALASGKASWSARHDTFERVFMMKQLLALEQSDREAANFLMESAAAALNLHGEDTRWLRGRAAKTPTAAPA